MNRLWLVPMQKTTYHNGRLMSQQSNENMRITPNNKGTTQSMEVNSSDGTQITHS